MAITHFTPQLIGRGNGRSAVLSAAYRHCAKMTYEIEARTVDYSNKRNLAHEEFLVPPGAPKWALALIADRSVSGAAEAFWNRVEAFEKREDAQFAKEFIIALPVELSKEQNVALMHQFVFEQVLARGQVADWVYHDEPGNPHVHLMTTLRPLTENGFGPKKIAVMSDDGQPVRTKTGKIQYRLWSGEKTEFLQQRNSWLDLQNQHLALGGLEIRVDGRSYAERGIDFVPTVHIGVGAKAIQRKSEQDGSGVELERLKLFEEQRQDNTRRIEKRPETVLDIISSEKSVFDQRDIARVLHRYIDDAGTFSHLMARILRSPEILRIERDSVGFATGERIPARYTTRELIQLEAGMAKRAMALSQAGGFDINSRVLETTFERHSRLSLEQKTAIEHVAKPARIAAVVGRAGAGKTTMMKAAREAWELAGHRVVGGALAGKAAEGLEKEAGIDSRTLASWELRWKEGRDALDKNTVFVLDEAGMVASKQMALFVEVASRAGAKLVLVGDPEQLQPIEAGSSFRAIVERIGYAELGTVYRQREQWMRDASLDLARGRVEEAVNSYQQRGRIFGSVVKRQAIETLIADWNREYDPTKTILILAHLRRDVRSLNSFAREKLVERGIVGEGHAFRTDDGLRRFDAGDQIVFLKNDSALGVKNGMIGRVVEATQNRIVAEIGEGDQRESVTVEQRVYRNVDHGYATTIHKSQGATVDRVKVLASLSLDRHLTYVAMTRHREDLALYYGRRSFDLNGGLIKILSKRNAKETTLDYERGTLYRQALRFAENRGLSMAHVARTLVRDRLDWTLRQKQRIADLAMRLRGVGERLGLVESRKTQFRKETEPMVVGITLFSKSLQDAVEEKLLAETDARQARRRHRVDRPAKGQDGYPGG
ncbi:Ti-type conjugative transfer relaxase TraA [Phyllobacterium endophyticum]|nr:Ti-type conjugative transfer relaxase TraA [Phyllobacterium endophyticum]